MTQPRRPRTPTGDAPDRRGLTICEVSSILGVPKATLRSWELRYAMPDARRESGRHRHYLPAQIHALGLMRNEIICGTTAAVAAKSVQAMLDVGGDAGAFIQGLLQDSARADGTGIRNRLDRVCEILGPAACVDDVLIPFMRQVGVWWQVGNGDQTQERTTTEAIRSWLDRRTAFGPPPCHPRPILLTCGPQDPHTIALESLAMLLRQQGWPCRILGARTPTSKLVKAALAIDAVAVVVISELANGRRSARESIRAVQSPERSVFYAGSAFVARRSRTGIPGLYLGTRINSACAQLVDALEPVAISSRAG